eukprot:Clim_evm38s149 gene=Clim_evmTU38s149
MDTEQRPQSVRCLIIDNYDSFTYNIFQYLASMKECDTPLVVHNNQYSFTGVKGIIDKYSINAVIVGPGPGSPKVAGDVGVSSEVIEFCEQREIPLLGICLGHQLMAYLHGGDVVRAPTVMHGRLSHLKDGVECQDQYTGKHQNLFDDTKLFNGALKVVRYHSLHVPKKSLPDCYHITAVTDDAEEIIMGMQHRTLPHYGMQFHPESISTNAGFQLLRNFVRAAQATFTGDSTEASPIRKSGAETLTSESITSASLTTEETPSVLSDGANGEDGPIVAMQRDLDPALVDRLMRNPCDFYETAFGPTEFSFWLDSARVEEGLSRYSFMGYGSKFEYHNDGRLIHSICKEDGCLDKVQRRDAEIKNEKDSFRRWLDAYMQDHQVHPWRQGPNALTVPFATGLVGYFGYNLNMEKKVDDDCDTADVPDAAFIECLAAIAFDHLEHSACVVFLNTSKGRKVADELMNKITGYSSGQRQQSKRSSGNGLQHKSSEPLFRVHKNRNTYVAAIKKAQELIEAGETYEVCLTTQIDSSAQPDPFVLYGELRTRNPAPYGAFFRMGPKLNILSSSPERFLRIDAQRTAESKPIKGTVARSDDPVIDEYRRNALGKNDKDFSENLMIVDLLRNDLGRVCEHGSVEVTKLMNVESYATVHQLVSTIRGHLARDQSQIDCIKACHPPGSMTGAPKVRTMTILEELEGEPRGIYSGTMGFLSFDGSVDLAVVIRTIVLHPEGLSIGAGGAIVALSDPEDEWDEMLLKARAPMLCIARALEMNDVADPTKELLVTTAGRGARTMSQS